MSERYFKTKYSRKWRKYEAVLKRDLDLELIENPTKILILCNAGADSGLNRADIEELVQSLGCINEVIFSPGVTLIVFKSPPSQPAPILHHPNHPRGIFTAFAKFLPDCFQKPHNLPFHPEGVTLINHFITPDEENALLERFDVQDQSSADVLRSRRVRHFWNRFNYENKTCVETNLVPPLELMPVIDKISSLRLIHPPDQITVSYYEPGDGIAAHVDSHKAFEGGFAILSLASPIVMQLSKEDKAVNLDLQPTSLLVLNGESRYAWCHGIGKKKIDFVPSGGEIVPRRRQRRVSITFRKVRRVGHCCCSFPSSCDDQS